jgi:DinB family protein
MAARRGGSLTAWRRQAVRRIVAAREATLAFVTRLPEAEILRPRTQDRWSVKDVLAHLMTCDEETIRRFRLIASGHGERIHWFNDMADADRFNASSVARARRLGLGAVLRRMARAHSDLIKWLERLPAASLRDPSHEYTVVQWLPAPGWTHEREHLSEIKAWWRTRPMPRAERRPVRRAARAGSAAASRRK